MHARRLRSGLLILVLCSVSLLGSTLLTRAAPRETRPASISTTVESKGSPFQHLPASVKRWDTLWPSGWLPSHPSDPSNVSRLLPDPEGQILEVLAFNHCYGQSGSPPCHRWGSRYCDAYYDVRIRTGPDAGEEGEVRFKDRDKYNCPTVGTCVDVRETTYDDGWWMIRQYDAVSCPDDDWVEIWPYRGEGSTYCIEDEVWLCMEMSGPMYLRLWVTTSEGTRLIDEWYDNGESWCLGGTMGPPTGEHRYRLDGFRNGELIASDETSVWVEDCSSPPEVKFRGTVLVDRPIISFYSVDVEIDEILSDPGGDLEIGQVVTAYGHRDGPAQVEDPRIGDGVEVFGEFTGHDTRGGVESDYVDLNKSDHYLTVLDTPPEIDNVRESDDPINKDGCPEPTTVTVQADVTDDSELDWVRLYYRGAGVGDWTYETMTRGAGDTYGATIGPFSDIGMVQYYVEARDTEGNEAESDDGAVIVNDCDTTPPMIDDLRVSNDPINKEGCDEPTTVTIRADVTDDSSLDWVRLYYRGPKDSSWITETMNHESGDTCVATVGPFSESGTLEYYVFAMDSAGNGDQSSIGTVAVEDCPGASITRIDVQRKLNGETETITVYEEGSWVGEGAEGRHVYRDDDSGDIDVTIYVSGGTPPYEYRLSNDRGYAESDEKETTSHTFSPSSPVNADYIAEVGEETVGPFYVRSPLGLVYDGPGVITGSEACVVDEEDHRITMGDHAHLRLPFKNVRSQPVSSATVTVTGEQSSDKDKYAEILIHNGRYSYEQTVTVTVTASTIDPGETGIADLWIYASNPKSRTTLSRGLELTLEYGDKETDVTVWLSPISFESSSHAALTEGSCLHNPGNFEIQRYAQYATASRYGAGEFASNEEDPDTPEEAVRNLLCRVDSDFDHDADSNESRVPDTTLLARQNGRTGACRHFADLTAGLLRSLGLPTRLVSANFGKLWPPGVVGHGWVESYTGGRWVHADAYWSTPSTAMFDRPGLYENRGWTVLKAWAGKHPLCSASKWHGRDYRCVAGCYETPVDCPSCTQSSNSVGYHGLDDSCVEYVTSDYHNVGSTTAAINQVDGDLAVELQGPTSVSRSEPFSLTCRLTNNTAGSLEAITATVAISEYMDSPTSLFDVTPHYRVVRDVGPGEAVDVTWTAIPLVAGSGIPLRVLAVSGDIFEVTEQPLVVDEPGTLPNLTLGGSCGLDTVSPGDAITLTAYVLDERLQPLHDAETEVSATVHGDPASSFTTSIGLAYCEACEAYKGIVHLPTDAPPGRHLVELEATRPGYERDTQMNVLYVEPSLNVSLSDDSPAALDLHDTVTMTAEVSEGGSGVINASVWATVHTPAGVATVPLAPASGGAYTLMFRPVDLAQQLDSWPQAGTWLVTVSAEYLGGTATAERAVLVRSSVYLPVVLRDTAGDVNRAGRFPSASWNGPEVIDKAASGEALETRRSRQR